MPRYSFQCECGVQEHLISAFSSYRPETCKTCGKLPERVVEMPVVAIAMVHRAVNDSMVSNDRGLARHIFNNEPDPEFGGKTAAEAVKLGLARTKDMKRDV